MLTIKLYLTLLKVALEEVYTTLHTSHHSMVPIKMTPAVLLANSYSNMCPILARHVRHIIGKATNLATLSHNESDTMNDHFRGLLLDLTKVLDKDHKHILEKLDKLISRAELLKYPILTSRHCGAVGRAATF